MKIKELFEAKKFDLAKHTDAEGNYKSDYKHVKVTYDDLKKWMIEVVLGALKAPPEVKADALYLLKETDKFHTDYIHDAAEALNAFATGGYGGDKSHDAIYNAIDDIGESIVDYYTNASNFGPGFVPLKRVNGSPLSRMVDDDEISQKIASRQAKDKNVISFSGDSIPESELMKLPAYVEGLRAEKWVEESRKARKLKADLETLTPEFLDKAVELFDAAFDDQFGMEHVKKVAKNPEGYEFDADFKPTTTAELIAGIKKSVWKNAVHWATDDDKFYSVGSKVLRDKKAIAYVLKNSKKYAPYRK